MCAIPSCVVCNDDREYVLHPHHVFGEMLSMKIEWVCATHHHLRHLEWSNVYGKGPRKKYGRYRWKYVPNVLTPRSLLPYFDDRRDFEITEEMRVKATAEWWETLKTFATTRCLQNTPYLMSNEALLNDAMATMQRS